MMRILLYLSLGVSCDGLRRLKDTGSSSKSPELVVIHKIVDKESLKDADIISAEEIDAEFKRFCLHQMAKGIRNTTNDTKNLWQIPSNWQNKSFPVSWNISMLHGPSKQTASSLLSKGKAESDEHPKAADDFSFLVNGLEATSNVMMKKSFLADVPLVCYEAQEHAASEDPYLLEKMLFTKKIKVFEMYKTSAIVYGFNCADRGFSYDRKPHPCYPDDMYTAFQSAYTQQVYRNYRQNLFDNTELGSKLQDVYSEQFGRTFSVTRWMLTGGCADDKDI